MRNPIGYVALSLLAAAFAGCSSTDTGSNNPSSINPNLTGDLAKYNSKIVPLTNACDWNSTTSKITYTLTAGEIIVLSLRAVDSAVLANGKECTYVDSKTKLDTPVTSKTLKLLQVDGVATTAETVIFDVRNGLFATGNIAVDLGGQTTNTAKAGDEIAVLGTTGADKMTCVNATSIDGIDLNADKTVDIKPVNYTTADGTPSANNHYTIDLNSGDDTFDQTNCTTVMSIYGSAGKDTITVGTVTSTVGDVYSGGTDGTSAAESVDTISFANRTYGVTVSLNGTADDGNASGAVEKDNVKNDFETVTGTAYADKLTAGALLVGVLGDKCSSYTLNGSGGNDILASQQNYGTVFNGGTGTDTVDYSARGAAITVTMDGKAADDGEKGVATTATLDNVGSDVENLIGSDLGDKITGNASNNVIKPGDGADVVLGLDGDDVMLSGLADGSDAADGNDIFQGGTGTDIVDYSNRIGSTKAVDINLDCTFTAATVLGTKSAGTASGTNGSETDYIGVDVENAVGTIGADTINGALLKCAGSDGAVLAPQPTDCDCYTPAGYICTAADATHCADAVTGTLLSDQSPCDCDLIPGSAGVVTVTCNPATSTPISSAEIAIAGGSCVAGTYVAGACNASATIACGGDSMDVASCKGDSDASQETACWKTQY